ncbi:MAG: hypothetical protein EOO27_03645 [Comamonadaceae bacterium]|nr:MAG: hypothetical protein EOO27_03645 [Comamonadaceae bacterium]
MLSIFTGFNSVRFIVQGSRIVILPMAVEIAKRERLERFTDKLAKGQALMSDLLPMAAVCLRMRCILACMKVACLPRCLRE